MELAEAILERRAVRRYLSTLVPDALIEKLIELATHAPSSMNAQPWAFAVVNDGM